MKIIGYIVYGILGVVILAGLSHLTVALAHIAADCWDLGYVPLP